jgi:hypothetical protein
MALPVLRPVPRLSGISKILFHSIFRLAIGGGKMIRRVYKSLISWLAFSSVVLFSAAAFG